MLCQQGIKSKSRCSLGSNYSTIIIKCKLLTKILLKEYSLRLSLPKIIQNYTLNTISISFMLFMLKKQSIITTNLVLAQRWAFLIAVRAMFINNTLRLRFLWISIWNWIFSIWPVTLNHITQRLRLLFLISKNSLKLQLFPCLLPLPISNQSFWWELITKSNNSFVIKPRFVLMITII